jgi:hypothetical protein
LLSLPTPQLSIYRKKEKEEKKKKKKRRRRTLSRERETLYCKLVRAVVSWEEERTKREGEKDKVGEVGPAGVT